MVADFGFGVLVLSWVICIYGIAAAVYGAVKNKRAWVESARLSMLVSFLLVTAVVTCLEVLLISGDYSLPFVYSVTSSSMPVYLKMTALWGGQAGSLLFWSWLLSAFGFAVSLRKWDRDREFLPWVVVVVLVTQLFFLSLSVFLENPFTHFWALPDNTVQEALFAPAGATPITPSDGNGMSPMLRHLGMVIHPPMLYLGFVSFVIPFAFAIAALITGRTDDRWIRVTRRWTLVAWLFLSLGLLLGSRWAYDVLGWGGYWGWDPVEIAALMPWLSGTAFLHSVMIQERRGMLKRWNMILVVLTYSLVIFGTFLTRSGVLSSVHAFAQSAIGPLFFAFIAATFIISLGLLLKRWTALHGETAMTSVLSRESLFLINNLIFMGILVVCFWGVIYPLISELLTGQKATVGPAYYKGPVGLLSAVLLLLMGVAPLSAWGHSTWKTLGKALWLPVLLSTLVLLPIGFGAGVSSASALFAFWLVALVVFVTLYEYIRGTIARHNNTGENYLVALWRLAGKNRRRYGGYIIHVGVVLMALGIIGIEMFQTQTQQTLRPGQSLILGQYSLTYDSLAIFDTQDGRNVARAVVSVDRGGQAVSELYPRVDYYYDSGEQVTIPGLRSTVEDDLYVVLVDWKEISTSGATFKVFHNPLVSWLWIGGIVFILGTLVAAWPDRDPDYKKSR